MADFSGDVIGGPIISELANLARNGEVLGGGGPGPAVQYYQRVWSTGTSVWCYYTQAAINPAPASTETTPNWVGSAVEHNVVTALTGAP